MCITILISVPPTVESAMSVLRDFVGRWKAIADGFGFNGDMIDEIDTNNEMNEACLQDCVEQWVARLGPSWEKISRILEDLGEERCLTVQECKEGSQHYEWSTIFYFLPGIMSDSMVCFAEPTRIT